MPAALSTCVVTRECHVVLTLDVNRNPAGGAAACERRAWWSSAPASAGWWRRSSWPRAACAVTVLERAAAPGGKLRAGRRSAARRIDAGPTVFTMRWVFDELFAAAGSVARRPPDAAAGRRSWRAMPGATDERLDLFADIERSADAIGALRRRRRGARLPRLLRRARSASIARWSARSSARRSPTPLSLMPRGGLRGLGDLWRHRAVHHLWRALGEHFRDPRLRQLFGRYATYCGSSPFLAPATLMLVAHVEQEGVWLVEGGMHRLAAALARLARRRTARCFRYGADVARDPGRAAAAPPACGWRAASGSRPTRWCATPTSRPWRPACSAAPLRRAVPRRRRADALAVGGDLGAAGARPTGFRCCATTSSSRATTRPSSTTCSSTRRLPRAPTVYVCAQDRDDRRRQPARPGRSGCCAWSTRRRPATARLRRQRRSTQCAETDIRPAGALRPDGASAGRSAR